MAGYTVAIFDVIQSDVMLQNQVKYNAILWLNKKRTKVFILFLLKTKQVSACDTHLN